MHSVEKAKILNVSRTSLYVKVNRLKTKKASKIMVFLMVTMLTLTFNTLTTIIDAQNGAVLTVTIGMEPATLSIREGELFNITVYVENLPEEQNLTGFQFKITWDSSVLTGVSMEEVLFHSVTPPDEEGNIWQLEHSVTASSARYAYTWQNITRALEMGYAPISGNHTVAVITLNATATGGTTLKFSMLKIGGYDVEKKEATVYIDYPKKPLPDNCVLTESTVTVGNPPPEIVMVSPENTTYGEPLINLTFTLSEPADWIGYSLDNQRNVTITGNTTITVPDGAHSIILYANDTDGNMGISKKSFKLDPGGQNKAYWAANSTDPPPTNANWTELTTREYGRVKRAEDYRYILSRNISGEYPLMLFSFKIGGCMEAIYKIVLKFEGYGTAPAGNGTTLKIWNHVSSAWERTKNVAGEEDKEVYMELTSNFSDYVDSDGYIWLLAKTTNPSNGTTPATIYTDYCSCTVTVKEVYFLVDSMPPEAIFTYSPAEPKAEIIFGTYKWLITFNASESYDNATQIVSYYWEFGDGLTENNSVVVTHMYRQAGTYNVTLTVKDEVGYTGTKTVTITLTEPPAETTIPWWIIISIAILAVWGAAIGAYLLKTKKKDNP